MIKDGLLQPSVQGDMLRIETFRPLNADSTGSIALEDLDLPALDLHLQADRDAPARRRAPARRELRNRMPPRLAKWIRSGQSWSSCFLWPGPLACFLRRTNRPGEVGE